MTITAFVGSTPLPARPFTRGPHRTAAAPPPCTFNPLRLQPRLPAAGTQRRARLHVAPRAKQDPLVLSEDNLNLALAEAKQKLGSIFGNSAENVAVGITGDVQLVSTDGPIVVLRLTGRFWHKRSDVLARVGSHLLERIPEICDIEIEDPRQLQDSEEESARLS